MKELTHEELAELPIEIRQQLDVDRETGVIVSSLEKYRIPRNDGDSILYRLLEIWPGEHQNEATDVILTSFEYGEGKTLVKVCENVMSVEMLKAACQDVIKAEQAAKVQGGKR